MAGRCGGRRGTAALEFALVAGVLFLIVGATVDIGSAVQQRVTMGGALRAAGLYAMSFPTNAQGIKCAVGQALPGWPASEYAAPIACTPGAELPPAWSDATLQATQCLCASAAGAVCSLACGTGGTGFWVLTLTRPSSAMVLDPGNCTAANGRPANCATNVIRFK
jgi:hypothetical protein